jgi:tRNA threonylcarbamoyladenosine modification (KEOPS) complex  Pcc1 subunit
MVAWGVHKLIVRAFGNWKLLKHYFRRRRRTLDFASVRIKRCIMRAWTQFHRNECDSRVIAEKDENTKILMSDVEKKQLEIDQLRQVCVHEHVDLISSLRADLAGRAEAAAILREELETSKRDIEQRDSDAAALLMENQELHTRVHALQSDALQLHDVVAQRDSLTRDLALLQAELDASLDYAAEMQRSLEAREADNIELKSRLDAQQLIFRDLALQSTQSQSTASRLQAQLDASQEELRENANVVSSLRAEVECYKLQKAELDASLDYAAEMQRSLEAREADNIELKSRLDAQQLIFRDLALQSTQSQSTASRLQAQLDASQEELRENANVVSSLRAELNKCDSRVSDLSLQVDAGKQLQLQLEDTISSLRAQLATSKGLRAPNVRHSHQRHASHGIVDAAAPENYDLLVVLADQLDKATEQSLRARQHCLHLLNLLRSRSSVSCALNAWNFHLMSQKINGLRWRAMARSLNSHARSRAFAALNAKVTSDRLRCIQEQTHALKQQLLEFMQDDQSLHDGGDNVETVLQRELFLCQQQRDAALAECDCACEAAAVAKSENFKTSELLLVHQLQVSNLMEELEQQKQNVLQLSMSHDALKLQLDKASAALVSQDQVMACNAELQRMVASAEAVSADTSSLLEGVQRQLQAALAEADASAAAKVVANQTYEAALRQLEQNTSIQSKQKERIQELSKSLSEANLELQSVQNGQSHSSQEVSDLKRSLAASVVHAGQLQETLDSLQSRAFQHESDLAAATRELCAKEEYIRVLLESLESSGKERQRLKLQVMLLLWWCDSTISFAYDHSGKQLLHEHNTREGTAGSSVCPHLSIRSSADYRYLQCII